MSVVEAHVAPDITGETEVVRVLEGLRLAYASIFVVLVIIVGWTVVRVVSLYIIGAVTINRVEINSITPR